MPSSTLASTPLANLKPRKTRLKRKKIAQIRKKAYFDTGESKSMAYQKKNNRPPRPGEGRPTKYDPKYCEMLVEYFDVAHFEEKVVSRVTGKDGYEKEEVKEIAVPPRFFSAFARKIKVDTSTLWDWAQEHPEFAKAYARAKEIQEEMLVSNGMKGLYDPRFTVFAAKNMIGWKDKTEVEHAIADETFAKYRSLNWTGIQSRLAELNPPHKALPAPGQ